MSNSSQPENSFETLTISNIDDIIKDCTIDLSGTGAGTSDISFTYDNNVNYISTITLTPTYTSIGSSANTFNIGSGSVSIDSIDTSSFAFNLPKEWVDTFPSWHRVKEMCAKYPGLEIALRNFETVYNLVKDDYDNPTPKK